MPERKSSAIIGDILNCIDHIQLYTSDISFGDFEKNFMVVEACLYNIQIIGEAVSPFARRGKRKRNSDSMASYQKYAQPAYS